MNGNNFIRSAPLLDSRSLGSSSIPKSPEQLVWNLANQCARLDHRRSVSSVFSRAYDDLIAELFAHAHAREDLTPSEDRPSDFPTGCLRPPSGVADETLITLGTGERVRAAELPAEFEVHAWSQDIGWQIRPARKWAYATQPVVRLETSLGRSVCVSPTQLFWTPSGWNSASKLQVGDSLAIARGIPAGASPFDADRAWLLGALVADCDLGRKIKQNFPHYKPHVQAEGLASLSSRYDAQMVPAEVFAWNQDSIARFVSGCLEVSALVINNDSGREIFFLHPSRQLIRDLAGLLLSLRVVGCIKEKWRYPGGRWGVHGTLSISGGSLVTLTAMLDPRGRNAHRLKSLRPRQSTDLNDRIPPSLLERFGVHLNRRVPQYGYKRDRVLGHVEGDTALLHNVELGWDRIKSITQEPPERTWAIHVPELFAFVASDLLTRNSEEP